MPRGLETFFRWLFATLGLLGLAQFVLVIAYAGTLSHAQGFLRLLIGTGLMLSLSYAALSLVSALFLGTLLRSFLCAVCGVVLALCLHLVLQDGTSFWNLILLGAWVSGPLYMLSYGLVPHREPAETVPKTNNP